MDVSDCIINRRSIRKYLDLEVPMEQIGKIIDAGSCAPSSGNLQNWSFIIVKDDDSRFKIADACFQQEWMRKAPVHIIVCSKENIAKQYYGIRGERLYTIQNCAAAIQNMLLMAHNQELGACWIGAFEEDMIKNLLNVPSDVRPQAIITIGVPNEEPPAPKKTPLTHIAFLEKFGNKIENLNAIMGYYGADIHTRISKNMQRLGDVSEKTGKHLAEHSKNILEKIREKLFHK